MPTLREHWLVPDAPFVSYAEYRAATGPSAVEKARALAPQSLLREIALSGLRGRGGAGFPAGTKWGAVAASECPTRYVVCNAAEGEPGTFKDRWLLAWNPYATLEGMLVAAHAVGARVAVIALKASAEREVARVRAALTELEAAGVPGGVEVRVALGPDEYLFGEEKALLEVISGNDPLPRSPDSPPYEVGLYPTPGSPNPAVVNNAETFAHVPGIVRAGAASFRAVGTQDTPGTLLFTVSGDVQRPGVYEAPAGTTLAHVFNVLAGGPRPGRTFKAALSGVSSRPLTPDRFDTPADFGSVKLAGSWLGSAGFVLLDDAASMPRVVQSVARFLYVESCNQCSACKHGLRTASLAIDELFDAKTNTPDDIPRALYGARSAPQANRCYLPVQGSVVIPAILGLWADEFEELALDPSSAPPPWPLPKITGWDEARRAFTYDSHAALKKPDWTFAQPTASPRARPATTPTDAATAAVSVRLAPDVAKSLAEDARQRGVALDTAVNEALREWLKR